MNQSNDTVSVIIPTFNRMHYLGECLDSILNQTIKPHQVIVIDDGSEDETQNLLKSYSDRVTVLKKENGGKAKALNMALPLITGEYIWLFDDDDVALPNSIESRLNVFYQNPDINVVYSSHFFGCDDVKGKILIKDRYNLPKIDSDDFLFNVMNGYFFTLQGMLIRHKCVDKNKAFDDNLFRSQDYDFIINLARKHRFIGLDSPTFIFRRHSGIRGPKQDLHKLKNKEAVWLKYDGLIGRKIRDSLSLSEYLPNNTKEVDNRLAFFRRMSVMASKGLIEEMLQDLQSALKLKETKLTSEESQICRQTVCHVYFLMQLAINQEIFFSGLNTVANNNKKQIKRVLIPLARGIFWISRQRSKTLKENFLYLLYFLKIIKIYFFTLKP